MKIPDIEKRVLKFWRESDAFARSVKKRSKNRAFVFYEGPPTANGKPGFHHVEARTFKDIICRYKTMQGFRVERRGGWDTHGLPVELEVEKKLGINNKKQIEEYGIAKFNKKCKESVWKYKKDWEELTERMGFWIDIDSAYSTYDPLYMESLWWIIKEAYKKDLLYEGHKVIPYCPRCGTVISSHEVAQGYQDIVENSVFVKFKVKNPTNYKLKPQSYLLAWTTTPWTLPGNVALAVGEDIKYSLIKQGNKHYILATELLKTFKEEYDIVEEIMGKDLVGVEYEPLFDSFSDVKEKKHYVVGADFVTTEEGTGIVHTAVMYGEDDYNLGAKIGLPRYHTVDEGGRFNKRVKEFEGQFVKDAEPAIIKHLEAKDLLYKVVPYKHSYPFCWRCSTPLLYYATNSWFVAMSKLRKQLLDANKKINWVPDYLKEGRFGDWLREVKDWAFSRSRYWGTPLPVWRCEKCENIEVVGSRKDLAKLTSGKNKYWLMRHGHSKNNGENILIGDFSKKHSLDRLSEKGKKQVRASAEQLKKEGGVDIIISSPLGRTKETAEIMGKQIGVEVVVENSLKEIGVGVYEGKDESEYSDYFKGERDYDFTNAVPGGENLAQVRHRMFGVVNKLEKKYRGKKILIVSHAHPIWMLETTMLGFTTDESVEWKRKGEYPQNAQVKKVKYAHFPYNNERELDFHRPFIDKIKFDCTKCKAGKMSRVQDLVDVWYDSGAMPFAQEYYPFKNKSKIDKGVSYPADYISEATDQTRGWFYTLHAVSAILGKAPAYKNVVSVGLVLDEKGQKMSKSKGNIVDPWELAEKYGMDAVRWYFFTVNNPGSVKRFSERDVREKLQRFISTFLNTHTFLNTYAPKTKAPSSFSEIKTNNKLDKWINAKLKILAKQVREYLNEYNITEAARIIDAFVLEDLSNWYVRRSRERFQKPKNEKEKADATGTLSLVLSEVAKVSAPFVPFITEYIWQKVNKTNKNSVHWEDFPNYSNLTKAEEQVLESMQKVQVWAQAGLRLRADNSLKVRQPLVALAVDEILPKDYLDILKDELNVKDIVNIKKTKLDENYKASKDNKNVLLNTKITDALFVEGNVREMVRNIQKMRKAMNLLPTDKISIEYSLPQELYGALQKWEKQIAFDTNAVKISENEVVNETHGAKIEFEWDNKNKVVITIDLVK